MKQCIRVAGLNKKKDGLEKQQIMAVQLPSDRVDGTTFVASNNALDRHSDQL